MTMADERGPEPRGLCSRAPTRYAPPPLYNHFITYRIFFIASVLLFIPLLFLCLFFCFLSFYRQQGCCHLGHGCMEQGEWSPTPGSHMTLLIESHSHIVVVDHCYSIASHHLCDRTTSGVSSVMRVILTFQILSNHHQSYLVQLHTTTTWQQYNVINNRYDIISSILTTWAQHSTAAVTTCRQ